MKNRSASLLVVSLRKIVEGILSSLCGKQVDNELGERMGAAKLT